MKRILITGATSWIGSDVEAHLATFPGVYGVERVSLRGEAWRERSWEGFDSVVHLAASPGAGPDALGESLAVNRDLTVAVAGKAKAEGVGQLIFASTMHVYGDGSPDPEGGRVGFETEPRPTTPYGIGKLEGERALVGIAGGGFEVAVLRVPLVYGPGCSGNFALLAKLARVSPVFPDVANRRSMIFSKNLAELVRLIVEDGCGGLFLPQDRPVSSSELVRLLADAQGSRVRLVGGLGALCRFSAGRIGAARKLLGSSWYDPAASECGLDYRLCSLEESVRITLGDSRKAGSRE